VSTSGPGRTPPAGIPTLTEVVPWPGPAPIAPLPVPPLVPPQVPPAEVHAPSVAPAAAPTVAAVPVATSAPVVASAPDAPINESQLAQRILADLQRQIDLMLEVRLREALAPVLARATDALIRDARKELTTAMRDAVARSVAQELARRANR
jgi:3-oxoacyl-ACP reductase-like protein